MEEVIFFFYSKTKSCSWVWKAYVKIDEYEKHLSVLQYEDNCFKRVLTTPTEQQELHSLK